MKKSPWTEYKVSQSLQREFQTHDERQSCEQELLWPGEEKELKSLPSLPMLKGSLASSKASNASGSDV